MCVLVLCHASLQSSANLLSATMASSLGTVYKSMEEYRSTCLSRSASPGIVNYGSSSTRTLLGTPSRYRSASPSIVNYGSSSTRTLLGTPSRYRSASPSRVDYSSPSTRTMLATPSSRSTSPSVFHRTMLATPAAMRPPSPSGSPSMATYNGFSTMRKVLPLSTHPAVSPSRIRVATTPSSIGHVHPLTANPSTSGQYPFGTHHHSQMHCIPQYETGPYHVRPHSQVPPHQVMNLSSINLHQYSAFALAHAPGFAFPHAPACPPPPFPSHNRGHEGAKFWGECDHKGTRLLRQKCEVHLGDSE